MAEKYTIMRTSRYGHHGAQIKQVYSVMRRDVKRQDDVISTCNQLASADAPIVNETIIYDVYYNRENGESDIIHTVEMGKDAKK